MIEATYKRLANGTYQVTTAKGPYTISHHFVQFHMVLSNVRRTGSWGNDATEPDAAFVLTRYIQASWKPEKYHFELISERGEQRADHLPVRIMICPGAQESSLSHFAGSEEHDLEEQFNISIYVPEPVFDWYWSEIERRPGAGVGVRIGVMLLMAGIEASMYYETDHKAIRLEPSKVASIIEVSLAVGDAEALKATLADQGAPSAEPPQRFAGATLESVWLKRIFFAVIALGLLLFISVLRHQM